MHVRIIWILIHRAMLKFVDKYLRNCPTLAVPLVVAEEELLCAQTTSAKSLFWHKFL